MNGKEIKKKMEQAEKAKEQGNHEGYYRAYKTLYHFLKNSNGTYAKLVRNIYKQLEKEYIERQMELAQDAKAIQDEKTYEEIIQNLSNHLEGSDTKCAQEFRASVPYKTLKEKQIKESLAVQQKLEKDKLEAELAQKAIEEQKRKEEEVQEKLKIATDRKKLFSEIADTLRNAEKQGFQGLFQLPPTLLSMDKEELNQLMKEHNLILQTDIPFPAAISSMDPGMLALYLLQLGREKINSLDKNGLGLIHHLCSLIQPFDAFMGRFLFLKSQGVDIHLKDNLGNTVLHKILFYSKELAQPEKFVEFLISQGLDVNAATQQGATPLTIAYTSGIPNLIKVLEKAGAHVIGRQEEVLNKMADEQQIACLNHFIEKHGDFSLQCNVNINFIAKLNVIVVKSYLEGDDVEALFKWIMYKNTEYTFKQEGKPCDQKHISEQANQIIAVAKPKRELILKMKTLSRPDSINRDPVGFRETTRLVLTEFERNKLDLKKSDEEMRAKGLEPFKGDIYAISKSDLKSRVFS